MSRAVFRRSPIRFLLLITLAVTLTIGLSPAASAESSRSSSAPLRVGESATTVNRDGSITTRYAVSFSCTQTYTAYTPFRTWDGRTTAKAYFYNGAGCGTVYPYTSLRKAGCCGGYSNVDSASTKLTPGGGWTVVHVYYCNGYSQKAYQTYAQIGIGSGATSRWAYLQCG